MRHVAKVFVLGPLFGVALSGCPQLSSFHTTVQGDATVPGDPNPLGSVLSSLPGFSNFGNLDFSQNQDFKNHGASKDHVTSVKADSVTVKIISPNNQDFSFLQSLVFSVQTGNMSAEVAHKDNISSLNLPAPNPTLTLDLDGEELQPYVTAPDMSIVVSGSGHPPPQDTQLEANVGLTVHFKLF